ncbi:unnamed protein product [Miscanthus lutarioriparius]|uniref:Uncharacterized protein n=1 Tax=Miscanthus lutarioriparius TaxID=422564 RepID=A0A811RKF5_9POAL|nr:unnamed protein product [Miscanthus lutarioriparius]
MASLLRVSRGFARAARHVAAPVARLGSGGAAPSDLPRSHRLSFLRGGSAVDAPPLGSAMSSHTDAPSPPASDVSGTTDKEQQQFIQYCIRGEVHGWSKREISIRYLIHLVFGGHVTYARFIT